MSYEVFIRYAQPEDLEKRQELVGNCFSIKFLDAFVFFFFQELTLECCVLGAAVMFIFFSASVAACTILLPAAATFVAIGVLVYRQVLAHKHMQNLSCELYGLVAEAHGCLLPPKRELLPIRINISAVQNSKKKYHVHIVGTISVAEFHGETPSGWIEGLAVSNEWRQRGVGAALLASTKQAATLRGLTSLETAVSELQSDARRLLLASGWDSRGAYERRMAGDALTLPVLRLGTDIILA